MPMRVPAEAKTIRDSRVELIRVITTLYDRVVNGDDGLKSRVKATMLEKDASFAESDLVIAALRPGAARSTIDPKKLHKLIAAKKLTLEQFLECVTVTKEPLKKFLAGNVIDELSAKGATPEHALFTEFKEGVQLDLEQLAAELAGALARAVPIKAA